MKNVIKNSSSLRFLEKITGGPLSFSELILAIRYGEEMSQVEFAQKLGISKSHLCDIEKNRKTVSPYRAMKFAKILCYSQEQFVTLALQDLLRESGIKMTVTVQSS